MNRHAKITDHRPFDRYPDRQPFWPFCGGRAARRISMHGKWVELLPMLLSQA